MVVCVGESFTVPDACEVEVSVRAAEPAVAVIVTALALVLCQFSVTLCPALIEFVLAENTRVGVVSRPKPLQALIPHNASGMSPPVI